MRFCACPNTAKFIGEWAGGDIVLQIDFRVAFYFREFFISSALWVLEVLCYLYWQFLSNPQHVMADGCPSKLINVVSGVPQGSIFGQLLFLLYTLELFSILEKKLISYADGFTLTAVVTSPCVRFTLAESVNRDPGKVSEWCDFWEMKLNEIKNETMIVSGPRTMHPESTPLTFGGTARAKESNDLDILRVTFYSNITFEKHLRSVSRAAFQRWSILKKSCRLFHDGLILGRCFPGFVMPVLEYCSAVWCSAADTHLKLLDRVVSGVNNWGWVWMLHYTFSFCDSIMYTYKIRRNPMHPLYGVLPLPHARVQVTRGALVAHRYTYEPHH